MCSRHPGNIPLLSYSRWFRRFALICATLVVVVAGFRYVVIYREYQQDVQESTAKYEQDTLGG